MNPDICDDCDKLQNECKRCQCIIIDRISLQAFMEDISGFISIIAGAIGERCKYYAEFTREEKGDRE